MPSELVIKLIERVAIVETKVKQLMSWQKLQTGLLVSIFLAVLGAWVSR